MEESAEERNSSWQELSWLEKKDAFKNLDIHGYQTEKANYFYLQKEWKSNQLNINFIYLFSGSKSSRMKYNGIWYMINLLFKNNMRN